jgi:hypothetical protein
VENIVEGKRQGAALPKHKNTVLAPSARSKISKLDYFLLTLKINSLLYPQSKDNPGLTYFQAKHEDGDPSLTRYRETKSRLRSSIKTNRQRELVKEFIDNAAAQSKRKKEDGEEVEQAQVDNGDYSPSQAPFRGWLVSGKRFESFTCQGICNHDS